MYSVQGSQNILFGSVAWVKTTMTSKELTTKKMMTSFVPTKAAIERNVKKLTVMQLILEPFEAIEKWYVVACSQSTFLR